MTSAPEPQRHSAAPKGGAPAPEAAPASTTVTEVPVWPLALRLGHWALAASVFTALWLHEGGSLHEAVGYAALALAGGRLAWGLVSRQRHLKLATLLRSPARTWRYARAAWQGQAPRYLGHNPLGGWMVLALLADATLAGASGALYATDAFWGDEVLYRLHQWAGWGLALLVPLHLAGVGFGVWRHREPLVRAMLTGRKPAPAAGDVCADAPDPTEPPAA